MKDTKQKQFEAIYDFENTLFCGKSSFFGEITQSVVSMASPKNPDDFSANDA